MSDILSQLKYNYSPKKSSRDDQPGSSALRLASKLTKKTAFRNQKKSCPPQTTLNLDSVSPTFKLKKGFSGVVSPIKMQK